MAVDRVAVIAFAKAVLRGGFAAAAPFLPLSAGFGLKYLIDFDDPLDGLYAPLLVIYPLIITLPIVLGASILIGLPLTYLLSRIRREQGKHYVAAGTLCGGLPFVILGFWLDAGALFFVALVGALGGAVTGWSWGRHRDALIAARYAEDADLEPTL